MPGGEKGAAMMRRQLSWAFCAVCAVLSAACSAHAQATSQNYKPTLSPWFGLYQQNSGPLDNYHTFVRPQIELQNTIQRQRTAIQRNSAGIRSLDQDMTDLHEHGTVRPTGTGSVFMDYSHFYPQGKAGGRSTQTPTARGRSWSPQPPSSGRTMASQSRGGY
jgi:hypothetical protein